MRYDELTFAAKKGFRNAHDEPKKDAFPKYVESTRRNPDFNALLFLYLDWQDIQNEPIH